MVLNGVDGLETVAALEQTQQVMAAIVGAAGLRPTLAAAHDGKRIMQANKEALVMSGKILMDAVRENDAELLPIERTQCHFSKPARRVFLRPGTA